MTFDELEKTVIKHGQILERHEFMLKQLTDLTGKVYESVDRQYHLLEEISAKIDHGFTTVRQCLDSHDAQIRMLQNTIRVESCKTEKRIIELEESVNRRFAEVNLRFDATDNRLDKLEARADEHDKRFDEHDRRFDEHDRRFDEHDRRFDEHDRRFDKIDNELAELKQLIIERLPKA